ncbi:hypothetical protein ACFL47_04580 [Candidatus Latescibacterota bacterium]
MYYNGGQRFTDPKKIEYLPSPGSHWMWNEDMGHIYTREWKQTYVSSVFRLNMGVTNGTVRFEAAIPSGSGLAFAVRSSGDEKSLCQQQWRAVDSSGFSVKPQDKFLQYRATFTSDNGDRFPVLDSIVIEVK